MANRDCSAIYSNTRIKTTMDQKTAMSRQCASYVKLMY